jgi:hypothetical protein
MRRPLEAPQYQARNSATGALLIENGVPVTGTYTWVATKLQLLVSDANRSAFVIESVMTPDPAGM